MGRLPERRKPQPSAAAGGEALSELQDLAEDPRGALGIHMPDGGRKLQLEPGRCRKTVQGVSAGHPLSALIRVHH